MRDRPTIRGRTSTARVGGGAVKPLKIDLHLQAPDTRPSVRRFLPTRLRRLAAMAGVAGGAVSVALVGDEQMAELHQQYSNVPGTTDVLTFDLRAQPGSARQPLDGEMVLCVDEAARQAKRRGHDTRTELLLYALHGLLHLLGYDDHTPAGFRAMHRREDELLAAAGLGRVFEPGPADRRSPVSGPPAPPRATGRKLTHPRTRRPTRTTRRAART